MQTSIDDRHHQLFEEAVALSWKIGLTPSRPRVVPRQVYRDNLPSEDIEGYYRENLTVSFLDHSLQQLRTRFPSEAYICYEGFSIVPTILLSNLPTWRECVRVFCEHYVQDIPNVSGLTAELYLWERLWTGKKENGDNIPDRVSSTLKLVDKVSFPNVFSILHILATIPVTSCSCERSISSLRHLKSYLRSTMRQTRLMHAHRNIPLDLEEIVDLFALQHGRRMRMAHSV